MAMLFMRATKPRSAQRNGEKQIGHSGFSETSGLAPWKQWHFRGIYQWHFQWLKKKHRSQRSVVSNWLAVSALHQAISSHIKTETNRLPFQEQPLKTSSEIHRGKYQETATKHIGHLQVPAKTSAKTTTER